MNFYFCCRMLQFSLRDFVFVMGIFEFLMIWNGKRFFLSMDYMYYCGMILVYYVLYFVFMLSLVEIY